MQFVLISTRRGKITLLLQVLSNSSLITASCFKSQLCFFCSFGRTHTLHCLTQKLNRLVLGRFVCRDIERDDVLLEESTRRFGSLVEETLEQGFQ